MTSVCRTHVRGTLDTFRAYPSMPGDLFGLPQIRTSCSTRTPGLCTQRSQVCGKLDPPPAKEGACTLGVGYDMYAEFSPVGAVYDRWHLDRQIEPCPIEVMC